MRRRSDFPQASAWDRADDDWYVDPPACTEHLLTALPLSGRILDPCCGQGTIVGVLRARGFVVRASDIADRGCPDAEVRDFLAPAGVWGGVDHVVTNPPYGGGDLAMRIIERALTVAPSVAALMPLRFLASERRRAWLNARSPSVYILSRRPSMPPGRELRAGTVKAAGGMQDYCWLAFRREPGRGVIAWLPL